MGSSVVLEWPLQVSREFSGGPTTSLGLTKETGQMASLVHVSVRSSCLGCSCYNENHTDGHVVNIELSYFFRGGKDHFPPPPAMVSGPHIHKCSDSCISEQVAPSVNLPGVYSNPDMAYALVAIVVSVLKAGQRSGRGGRGTFNLALWSAAQHAWACDNE